jgi:hypothetical protein
MQRRRWATFQEGLPAQIVFTETRFFLKGSVFGNVFS